MKNFRLFTAVLALCAAASVAPALRAADDTATAPAAAEHPRLDELAKKLNLTDEQKAKIVPIIDQEAADLKALQADTSMRPMQKLRKARGIGQKASDAIRGLLTPEQQTQYDAIRAEAQAKMKERIQERRTQGSGAK